MRIVVTGGGTGGHIFPAIAVAESLQRLRPDVEILYIGGSQGMETELVPQQGLPFRAIEAKKLRKVASLSTIGVGLSLWRGYGAARRILREFGAQAVVGTGGYVAAAATLAGVHQGLPTLIVAPDLVPGRTNRLLARRVRRVCVTFAASLSAFPAGRGVVTGMPLRAGIVADDSLTPQAARCPFPGLRPEGFTLTVIGGSQGARAINIRVLDALPALLDAGVQVLHQTGHRNWDDVQEGLRERGLTDRSGYMALPFFNAGQMANALRAADLLVCRGGISSLAEATASGLPAFVIPLPTAYADHQTHNARALEQAGAAVVLSERELTGAQLARDILALRDDPARQTAMRQASRETGRPDAADAVARETLALL